jgi:peptidoglycan/LPS O-acetylase OafA/YrhL
LPGGFIGVDVFFVISGFLITGLLMRERDRTGRISVRHFYSRRLRRIFPAVLATIAVTMVASAALLAPMAMPDIAQDGAWAAVSMANIRFALESADYFAASDASPFRHLWSLGVEEQFYLVWPALLIVVLGAVRSRLAAAAVIAALTIGSFGFGLWMTEMFAPWAFYSLPSRIWELSLGGLLAIAGGWIGRVPERMLVPVGWLGVALVAAGLLAIDAATPYPGTAALLPALGTAALIVGGGRPGAVAWLLTRSAVRFIGRISYSLYLWHWPILILPALAAGEPLPLELRLALGLLSVAVAAASWRLIEEPFRRGRLLTTRPRVVARTAVTAAVAVAALSLGLGDYSLQRVSALDGTAPSKPNQSTADLSVADASRGPSGSAGAGSSIVSPPPKPIASSKANRPTSKPTLPPRVTQPPAPKQGKTADPWPLPADVSPSLAAASSDKERIIKDRCFMSLSGSVPPDCAYGDPNGTFTVALVGDSHAAHWFPAVEAIAANRGWRLLPFIKVSCVFVDLPIYSPILKRRYTECEAWRPQVVDRLIEARPDLTIVSSDRWLPTMAEEDSSLTRQGRAMARLLSQIPGAVTILGDTPASRVDVPVCLSQHPDDITNCATSRRYAFGNNHLVREKAAAEASSATVIDMSNLICPGDPCQAVVGNIIVMRDDHHLTATFAASLAGALEAALPIPR